MTRLGLSLAALFLVGAATPPAKHVVTAPNGVEVTVRLGDEFETGTAFTGPNHQQRADDGSGDGYFYFLAAEKPRAPLARHVWAIRGAVIYSGDLRFYETARYKGGEQAHLQVTDRKPVGCGAGKCHTAEDFFVTFSPSDIDSHWDADGLAVKLEPRSGPSLVLQIPKAEIEAVRVVMKSTSP